MYHRTRECLKNAYQNTNIFIVIYVKFFYVFNVKDQVNRLFIFHIALLYIPERQNLFGMVEVFYLLVPGVVLAHQRNPPHGERRRPLHCPQPKISNRSKDYWKFSAKFWQKAHDCVKTRHLQHMLLRGQSSSKYVVIIKSRSVHQV